MKTYAFFYHFDLAGKLAEGCGDRAVIQIDGRHNTRTARAVAADECKKRGYIAYQLATGARILAARNVGPLVRVDRLSDLETISEVIHARGAK